jgi:hypothetical protein
MPVIDATLPMRISFTAGGAAGPGVAGATQPEKINPVANKIANGINRNFFIVAYSFR